MAKGRCSHRSFENKSLKGWLKIELVSDFIVVANINSYYAMWPGI